MPPKRATEHLIAESAEDLRSPGVIPFLLQHSPELLLHTYRRLSPAQTRDIPEIDWKGILPKYVAGDISGHAFLRFMTELKDRRHEKPLLKKLLADFVKEMNSLNKNDLKRLIRRDPRRFIQVLVQSSLALGKPVTLLSQIDPETFVGRPSGDRLEELISLKTIMKNTLGQSSVHTPEVETFVKAVNRTIWSRLPVSTAKHMLEYGEPEDVIVLIEDEPKRHDIIDAALTALPKGSWQDASYRAAFLVHGIEEPRYREQLEGIIRLAKSLKLPEYPEVMDAIRLRLGSSHENTRLAAQRLLDEYDSDIKQRPAPQEAPKSDPACGDLMSRLQRDNNP